MIHSHLHLQKALNAKNKWAKPGNIPKIDALSKTREHLDTKITSLYSPERLHE
jgi:hypothetical protein